MEEGRFVPLAIPPAAEPDHNWGVSGPHLFRSIMQDRACTKEFYMGDERTTSGGSGERPFRIQGLGYVSLYFVDLEEACAFYGAVFGPPHVTDPKAAVRGWRMGTTWLSLFPAEGGTDRTSNPKNTEFAVRVGVPEEVDALVGALVAAGATACMPPQDTEMYERMRFACVDDPFGVRIDVYCPINGAAS